MATTKKDLTVLLRSRSICKLIRPLSFITAGLTLRELATRARMRTDVARRYLNRARIVGAVRYKDALKRWVLSRSQSHALQLEAAFKNYEIQFLKRRSPQRCNAEARLRAVDELAVAIFHARKHRNG
jgi:hypothetical protein